jgi:hypothetical protein
MRYEDCANGARLTASRRLRPEARSRDRASHSLVVSALSKPTDEALTLHAVVRPHHHDAPAWQGMRPPCQEPEEAAGTDLARPGGLAQDHPVPICIQRPGRAGRFKP